MPIRKMHPSDWPQVEKIYLEGIATNNATLELESPGWEKWDKNHFQKFRYVEELDKEIRGWVALSPVSGRCVYAGVAEVSIYIGKQFRGHGIGIELIEHIIQASEDQGVWTLVSAMFPENLASIQLHSKAGFKKLGIREKIGKHHGQWRDILLMERRSKVVW